MSPTSVEQVADAVLYEGYMLYPYRPSSVKNRQRWTFGGVVPRAFADTHTGEASAIQAECLVRGTGSAALSVKVRFLHLLRRSLGVPADSTTGGEQPAWRPVETLTVDDRVLRPFEEATAREVETTAVPLAELISQPLCLPFALPAARSLEPVRDAGGAVGGFIIREQQALAGVLTVSATALGADRFRVGARLENETPFASAESRGRDEALLHAFVSAHLILSIHGGAFVSLMDPPDDLREAAAACQNTGCWPVLAGEEGRADTLLASPIILYDYPQIAPESPGDLFDGTEIDEILSLRILTLTGEEKRQAAAVDERARALLARTERLGADELFGLHGTIRSVRAVPGEADG